MRLLSLLASVFKVFAFIANALERRRIRKEERAAIEEEEKVEHASRVEKAMAARNRAYRAYRSGVRSQDKYNRD